ncbi:MAG: hypothetical protein ACE5JU_09930 [Candidatus Binatia bacterium]
MTEIKYLSDSALATIINDDAALANNVRAAADFNNDTELDLGIMYFLQEQFDATAPAANTKIAELYVLPGDGAATELFPEGGDAGLGTDNTPQKRFLVEVFETINPSITVNELLGGVGLLYPHGNRHVLLNISGQQFDLTWELRGKPYKLQSV